jgi:hypothetical protein
MQFSFKPVVALTPLYLLLGWSLGASVESPVEQAPQLRLPETVTPVSYRAQLTLDPAHEDFSGRIEIKIKIRQSVQIIWLNGTQLAVEDAVLKANGQAYTAKPVVSGSDFVGLQFASSIGAGDGELTLRYTGKVRIVPALSAWRTTATALSSRSLRIRTRAMSSLASMSLPTRCPGNWS